MYGTTQRQCYSCSFYWVCIIWVDQPTCHSLCKIKCFHALCLKVITIKYRVRKCSILLKLSEVDQPTWMPYTQRKASESKIVFKWYSNYWYYCNIATYMHTCIHTSRWVVMSHEAKKKEHAHVYSAYVTTTVSYLHGWSV